MQPLRRKLVEPPHHDIAQQAQTDGGRQAIRRRLDRARRIDELGVPADLKPGTILVCRLADETWLRIGHRYLVRDVQRDNRGAPLVVLEGLPDIVWGAWRFQGVEQ